MATPGSSASTAEKEVRSYWESNERIYVGQETFYTCMPKIQPWLNIPCLVPYLQECRLATSTNDIETITNPFLEEHQRLKNLWKLVEQGGEHGYFLLYMCIRKSQAKNPHGHGDAVAALESHARSQNLRPPWENSSSNSHPDNSPTPRLEPDGSHSSLVTRGPHFSPAPQGVDRLPPLSPSTQLSSVPVADSVPLPPQLKTTAPVSSGEGSVQNMSTAVDSVGKRVATQPGKMPKTRSRIGVLS